MTKTHSTTHSGVDHHATSSPSDEVIREIAASSESCQFLIDDYKLKVQYLVDHFSRMWTRLNYFVTVQLALFSALGYVLFGQGRDLTLVPIVVLMGFVVSCAWYIVGAQDRFLVSAYRDDLEAAAKLVSEVLTGLSWYGPHYVGSRSGGPPRVHVKSKDYRLLSWYVESLSITRLPSLLGIIFVLLWVIVGLMWNREVWPVAETRTPGSLPWA